MDVNNQKLYIRAIAPLLLLPCFHASAFWTPATSFRFGYDFASDRYFGTSENKADYKVSSMDVRYGGVWTHNTTQSIDVMSQFYLADNTRNVSRNISSNEPSKQYAELKTLKYKQLFPVNYGTWSLEGGRSRFRESSGILWDQNIEGISANFNSTALSGQARVSQKVIPWRTDGTDFQNADKKIQYFSFFVDYQWRYQQHLRAYLLNQRDYSGKQTSGQLYHSDDLDRYDHTATWFGVGITGHLKPTVVGAFDILAVHGNGAATQSVSDTGKRRVTGEERYGITGWLVDTSLTWQLPTFFQSTLGLHYLQTSRGSDHKNTLSGFIQPDVSSNRYTMKNVGLSMYKTGYAYRMELTNLSVASVSMSAQHKQWRAGIQWSVLNRRNAYASAGTSDININGRLTDGKKNLGQALDTQIVWQPQHNAFKKYIDRTEVRLRSGWFRAGSAYGRERGDTRIRVALDLIVRIH